MTPDPIVRPAALHDATYLAPLNGWSEERVATKIDRAEFVIAERGGVIVGFARLGFLWSELPFIELILVPDERHRRRGVGAAMLRYLEAHFVDRSQFIFSSCNAGEQEPQAWHRRHGFEDCGYLYQVNSPQEGEVFFRKAIGAPSP